jgi:hypothetical protein
MKPAQAFGVAVRIVGLLFFMASILYVASGVLLWVLPNYRPNVSPWWHYLLFALFCFLVGWFLLRRADRVVGFAYRQRDSDEADV